MEPQRPRSERELICERDIRAQIFSVGGAVVLALCLVLTALTAIALMSPGQALVQQLIAVMLCGASWLYLLSSMTERLQIEDHMVIYSSALGRTYRIPLEDLDEMLLVHQGFNLERGIETIEFRKSGMEEHERISLGPCWQRHHLEAFLHSVEEALNESDLLEEVR
jgi:hypothetical protein